MKKLKEIKIKIYFVENGTIQASKQEEKAGKVQEADKMGSFLDSAEDIWQDKKSPPRQAHEAEEALEKKEEQGVKLKMLAQISGSKPVGQERKTEPFFYNEKEIGLLTRLYDNGVLWKAILTAYERHGQAEEGLKIAVRNSMIKPGSTGIEIGDRV